MRDQKHRERDVPHLPELPELILGGVKGRVFPGPGVPSAISDPHVVTLVGEHVAQAGVRGIGNPVASCCQEAVLKQHSGLWACMVLDTHTVLYPVGFTPSFHVCFGVSETYGAFAATRDPVHRQDVAILRHYRVFLSRVSPVPDDLRLHTHK